MHGQMLPSLLVYLLVAAIMTAAGSAVLRPWTTLSSARRVAAAPAATLAFWALVLGITGVLSIRVSVVAWPLWVLTLLLALAGTRDVAGAAVASTSRGRMLVGVAVLAPFVTGLPYAVYGLQDYPGSRFPDAWSYAAYGQYLWTFPRGIGGDLGPLYEFASHLSGTRHVSPSLLGLLSCLLTPGDTQAATGLLICMAIFTLAAALLAVGEARGLAFREQVVLVLVAAGGGWILNAVNVANYDNLVALSAWPAMAAVLWMSSLARYATWVGFGAWLAALVYTYPEFGTIMGGAWVVSLAWKAWRQPPVGVWRRAAAGALTTLVLLAPYATVIVAFIRLQVAAGVAAGVRPGSGTFPGLLVPRHVVNGMWGLGGEHGFVQVFWPRTLLAVVLTVLLVLGIASWWRQRQFDLIAALAVPVLGAPLFLAVQGYDYGGYKMILTGWWVLALALVEATRVGAPRRFLVAAALTLPVLGIPAIALARAALPLVRAGQVTSLEPFRELSQVRPLVGEDAVGVFVEDGEAEHWATYFLRDTRLRLGTTRGYFAMDSVRTAAETDVLPWQAVRYLLTDATDPGPVREEQSWTLVWQNARYRLWDTSGAPWAVVASAATPNGFEQLAGKPFFWVGGPPTTFRVIASTEACVAWTAATTPGPSVRGTRRTIEATAGAASRTAVVTDNRVTVALPLAAGVSTVTLRALEAPDVPASNDPRPLVLGVTDLALRSFRNPARIVAVINPHGLEALDGAPFFWLGPADTTIEVQSESDADVVLSGQPVLGPSVSGAASRRVSVTVGTSTPREVVVTDAPIAIPLRLPRGTSRVVLRGLDTPDVLVQPNGDRRALLLGVRNLGIASAEAQCSPR